MTGVPAGFGDIRAVGVNVLTDKVVEVLAPDPAYTGIEWGVHDYCVRVGRLRDMAEQHARAMANLAEGAAAAIVFNWDVLSFIPMIGLHVAVISLIGRFVGARDMARTNEVITAAFTLALTYSALLAIVYSSLRFPLVDVFEPPGGDFTAIRDLAAFMMIGLSCYVMADAVILVSGGILRGAGDTRWLMVASVSLHWAMLVAQFFIIRVFGFGPTVSWLAFVVLVISIAATYAWRLYGGRWRDPEALERVMAE